MTAQYARSEASQNPIKQSELEVRRNVEYERLTLKSFNAGNSAAKLQNSAAIVSGMGSSQANFSNHICCNISFGLIVMGARKPSGSKILVILLNTERFVSIFKSTVISAMMRKVSDRGFHTSPNIVCSASPISRSEVGAIKSDGSEAKNSDELLWYFRNGKPDFSSLS